MLKLKNGRMNGVVKKKEEAAFMFRTAADTTSKNHKLRFRQHNKMYFTKAGKKFKDFIIEETTKKTTKKTTKETVHSGPQYTSWRKQPAPTIMENTFEQDFEEMQDNITKQTRTRNDHLKSNKDSRYVRMVLKSKLQCLNLNKKTSEEVDKERRGVQEERQLCEALDFKLTMVGKKRSRSLVKEENEKEDVDEVLKRLRL